MSKKTIPNISTLHKDKNVKEKARNEIFTIVLNKCIDKIIETNTLTDKTYIYFEVPNNLIGIHNYDPFVCVRYLMQELSREKYKVEFLEPYYLYVDWSSVSVSRKQQNYSKPQLNFIQTTNPLQLKQQTKELLKKYPNTSKVIFEYDKDTNTNLNKKDSKKKTKK